MHQDSLSVLCNPKNHSELTLIKENTSENREFLLCPKTGETYPIYDDIPIFQNSNHNNSSQPFYSAIAPLYDFLHAFQSVNKGGEHKMRSIYLNELNLQKNSDVLEISVGTGANIRYLPDYQHYFGLDISLDMLKQCKRLINRSNKNVQLIMGNAEQLPFKENSFDVVFNTLSLRLFNDRTRAINEMIRVAKPGGQILIADQIKSGIPLEVIPKTMLKTSIKESSDWKVYCLTFQKPGKSRKGSFTS